MYKGHVITTLGARAPLGLISNQAHRQKETDSSQKHMGIFQEAGTKPSASLDKKNGGRSLVQNLCNFLGTQILQVPHWCNSPEKSCCCCFGPKVFRRCLSATDWWACSCWSMRHMTHAELEIALLRCSLQKFYWCGTSCFGCLKLKCHQF